MKKTLGGERLGSGNKMEVALRNFERSSHDLGYVWKNTQSPGTLVPFMVEVALPGDTFDIDLATEVMTHPTVGPLFDTYKLQLDVFIAPIRLYNALLHNNELGIGMKMDSVKLPIWTHRAKEVNPTEAPKNIDNIQINPSCIWSYLGLRGVGITETEQGREFQCVPLLGYWEIYKNYYANKSEGIGAVIHEATFNVVKTVYEVLINVTVIEKWPSDSSNLINDISQLTIKFTGDTPILKTFIFKGKDVNGVYTQWTAEEYGEGWVSINSEWTGTSKEEYIGTTIESWDYISPTDILNSRPQISTFELSEIDEMRKRILRHDETTAFNVGNQNLRPYLYLKEEGQDFDSVQINQEGLGLKTYQSDIFNNWLDTEWIDGSNGINEITKIDTTDGLKIDALILARKVYDMLNQIAVSGGSYDDWLDAVYMNERARRTESPAYVGGLIKEIVFQEVVSNSASEDQPLGTLAGRGKLSAKNKGGSVKVKVDEPSYIIGIVSITPRISYSQGNRWDVHLKSLNDLHKPHLDEIGFQELITEQMAWWETYWDENETRWIQRSAGKQPAWLNYMTNYNRNYGNFAIQDNEMFMTLNRNYQPEWQGNRYGIKDLTTYIDPSVMNYVFADTSIDAMNFWVQVAVDITARRKMSAKIMPNL